ncbi:hypothetical protein D3C76_114530 [compost metagenome]
MTYNTWGLQFVKIDTQENEFKTLLALNSGSEEKAWEVFNRIKAEFAENTGEPPDCVIDLLDKDDSIVDDFAITLAQAKTIAS